MSLEKSMLEGLTVRELIDSLEEALACGHAEEDTLVVVGCDYGDRLNTTQAIPAQGCETAYIETTGYSSTGWCIIKEDGNSDGIDTDKEGVHKVLSI